MTTASKAGSFGEVINVTSLSALKTRLEPAKDSAATIFFTSSTCGPCRAAYPMFDQLAAEYPNALFAKVDINSARDVASKYQIRATPTFMTFCKGSKVDEWKGADPNLLKTNVERLMQQTWPPHPHTLLNVPALQYGSLKPVIYGKVPPLEKLMGKLGDAAASEGLLAVKTFVEKRNADAREATLPDLGAIGKAFQNQVLQLPIENRFAAIDLLRLAMVDARVTGVFAEEQQHQTISALIAQINDLDDCPHNLRLVTLYLGCNIFSSALFVKELMHTSTTLSSQLIQLITTSLLDASHPTTRNAAASLAFNLASANYRIRREEHREALDESLQVELAASLVETLASGENADATKTLLLALGYLVYCAPQDGEVLDLVKALDAKVTVGKSKSQSALAKEVAQLL